MSDIPQGPGWWMADDERWYPPEQRAGASTAPPVVAPDDPTPLLATTPTAPPPTGPQATYERRGSRWLIAVPFIVGLIVLGVLVFKIIAGQDTATEASTKPPVTAAPATTAPDPSTDSRPTTTIDAMVGLRAAASVDGGVLKAMLVNSAADSFGIVVISEDNNDPMANHGAVRIWQLKADGWRPAATVQTAGVVDDLTTADVTADGVPDAVIDVITGNQGGGAVLITTGPPASWKLAAFGPDAADGTPNFYPGSLKVADGFLSAGYNTCEPTCAAGNVAYQRFEWNGERFVASP